MSNKALNGGYLRTIEEIDKDYAHTCALYGDLIFGQTKLAERIKALQARLISLHEEGEKARRNEPPVSDQTRRPNEGPF